MMKWKKKNDKWPGEECAHLDLVSVGASQAPKEERSDGHEDGVGCEACALHLVISSAVSADEG